MENVNVKVQRCKNRGPVSSTIR